MSKHTPGPWWVASNGSSVLAGDRNDPGIVADAEVKANARLIAAAPKLLSALKDMCELFDLAADMEMLTFEQGARVNAVATLIAKVEGGK